MMTINILNSAWPRRQAIGIALLLALFVLAGCPSPTGNGGSDTTEDTGGDSPLEFTVSYDNNGATSGTAPGGQTKIEGVDLTLSGNSGNLARDGYSFAGWNTAADGSGTDYAEGATYTADADVTLYAKWTALPTYTVSYNANDATSGTAPGDQTKTEGVDLTLADNTGGLARSGFTFAGWNTADDGSGTDYAEGATYTADADVTLYAKWTALPTYTVSYNANDATSGTAPGDQTKTEGVDLTLADNTGSLARDGFTFAGWNTATDGSGTDYAEGATYSADANLLLYAKWVPYAIGDTGPAGGIVFYDKGSYSDGWRYLEAWTADETSTYRWKTINTSTTGTSTAVGSGYANTYTAMAGSEHPAAEVVRNATHGGRNDWFLPSKDELNQMHLQRGAIGGFASAYYWSSSEGVEAGAWTQYFDNSGVQPDNSKLNEHRVRAVRDF